jgi:hypothetical protein
MDILLHFFLTKRLNGPKDHVKAFFIYLISFVIKIAIKTNSKEYIDKYDYHFLLWGGGGGES